MEGLWQTVSVDRLFAWIPKNILAFLAIAGGICFILISHPPRTVCDSQLEVINEAERSFLFKDPKSQVMTTTKYERLRDNCKITNSPGGCYELFQELKTLLHDLGTLNSECAPVIGAAAEYKRAMWESAELILRLGWGERPPASYLMKFGWLERADIWLFCRLKDRLVASYGQEAWNRFREEKMRDLPGAKNLTRDQIWELSIFSEDCARYP